MLQVALRNVLSHRRRLVATVVAVVVGVSFMTGTLVLTDTIGRTFDQLFADVNEGVDAYVRAESHLDESTMGEARPRLDAAVERRVAAVDGVLATAPQVEGYAEIVGDEPSIGSGPQRGSNWIAEATLNPFRLDAGRAPETRTEVVVDRATATDRDLALGTTVSVATKRGVADFVVVGIARFGSADRPGTGSFVFFDDATAQELLAERGLVDGVRVAAEPGIGQREVADRLLRETEEGVEVLTGAELTAEDQDQTEEELRFFSVFLLTFAVIALLVGSFLIANTFSMLVAQRSRETALLRAIGATRRQVMGATVAEAGVVGFGASVIGVAAGVGLAAALWALMDSMGIAIPATGLVVTSSTVVTGLVVGTTITMIAVVQPARTAARMAPVAAMRPGMPAAAAVGGRAVTGAATFGSGVALVLWGVVRAPSIAVVAAGAGLALLGTVVSGPVAAGPIVRAVAAPIVGRRGAVGSLARENAIRDPRRTAATASALLVGIALVATVTVLGASANASIEAAVSNELVADVVVDTGMFATTGISSDLAGAIDRSPATALTTTTQVVTAMVDGRVARVTGIDPERYGDVVDVRAVSGSVAALGGSGILVQHDIAVRRGWSLGDEVTIGFAASGEHRFAVVGTYARGALAGDYLVSRDTLEGHVTDHVDSQILVVATDGVDPIELRDRIATIAADHPNVRVQHRDQFTAAVTGHVDEMLNLVSALLVLAVVIALLGIANTLSLAIVERTRELGLLRAVGMTRHQVRTMIRIEAWLVAVLGSAVGIGMGIGCGAAIAHALTDQGIDHIAVPAGRLTLTALLAAVAGVLAALRPARRAARLDVLRAIATS